MTGVKFQHCSSNQNKHKISAKQTGREEKVRRRNTENKNVGAHPEHQIHFIYTVTLFSPGKCQSSTDYLKKKKRYLHSD